MPWVLPEDVHTKEVLSWKGVHIFYSVVTKADRIAWSSRKVLFFLNLKKIPFTLHVVEQPVNDWFVGLNPKGPNMVPMMVCDGAVMWESNDICLHLERLQPSPPVLVPPSGAGTDQDLQQSALKFFTDLYNRPFCPDELLESAGSNPQLVELFRIQESYHNDLRTIQVATKGSSLQCLGCVKGVQAHFDGMMPECAVSESRQRILHTLQPIDAAYARSEFLLGGTLSIIDMSFWMDIKRLLTLELLWDVEEALPHIYASHMRLAPLLEPLAPMYGLITQEVSKQCGLRCTIGLRMPNCPGNPGTTAAYILASDI